MRFSHLAKVTTKPALRQLGISILMKWIPRLDRDEIRIHFPRRRGLMQVLPETHFHLWPEIFLQISGRTTFEFPEETCHVGPGEICLVSRGLPHRESIRSWKGPFFNIVIAYTPEYFHFHLARERPSGGPEIVVSVDLPGVDSLHLADLLKNVSDWHHEGEAAYRYAIKGSLMANLSIILAALKEEPAATHEPLKVIQVRQWIMQHLSQPDLTVNSIGRSLQCSPDYLSRLFRESAGKPLVAYITERRILRAKELLVSSTLNISEISRACGYEDPSYFTRVFRKETGIAPRHYRDQEDVVFKPERA